MRWGVKVNNKPHIMRAQPYDGDVWICFGNKGYTSFGRTPKEAFDNWILSGTETVAASSTGWLAPNHPGNYDYT
jgi:hypothetical protein